MADETNFELLENPSEKQALQPGHRFSIAHMLQLTASAGIFLVGVRNNWPDYLGIVWLVILVYLIHSSARQVIQLIRKHDLPMDDAATSTRWSWIVCRSVGAIMLIIVIFDPAEFVSGESPWREWSTINAKTSMMALYRFGRSLCAMGILFCIIPLWRIRQTPLQTLPKQCVFGIFLASKLMFFVSLLVVTTLSIQSIPAFCCMVVSGMDLALPTRFGGKDMFEPVGNWNAAKFLFADRCSWLAADSIVLLLTSVSVIRTRGKLRQVSLVIWLLTFSIALCILYWIYDEGAAALTHSWKYGVGYPIGIGAAFAVAFLLLGGFVFSLFSNSQNSECAPMLTRKRIRAFVPHPIMLIAIVTLILGQTFTSWIFYSSLMEFKFFSGLETEFEFICSLFSTKEAGPVVKSISYSFEEGLTLIWMLVFCLIAVKHWGLIFASGNSTHQYVILSPSSNRWEMAAGLLIASLALGVTALSLGWYGFASSICSRPTLGIVFLQSVSNSFEKNSDLWNWTVVTAIGMLILITMSRIVTRCYKWWRGVRSITKIVSSTHF